MFSCYRAPRRYKQRIGIGNLGGCMDDIGYRVRRCTYHRHHRQSAEPLRRLQPSFDCKKRQILCPSAKGSFHDSTILRRSNSRGPPFIPPFSMVSSLAAKFYRTPSRNTSSNLQAESFLLVLGRGNGEVVDEVLHYY